MLAGQIVSAQFYFGADLSYVNEMEDCGVTYYENGQPKDPYTIFRDHNCGLVRLRLWHTPSWYDNLNDGIRYSDLADVKRSIARAKAHDMAVLLDFHLSDNWADPGKQVVPAAWAPVVDDLPVLQDSLYNYIRGTLHTLDNEGLLPEMVQIGNETNRGILLSQEVNDAGWVLDWDRNSALFNSAIDAVRDFEDQAGKEVQIVIHAADPDNRWIFDQFIDNGVTDFDIMGLSYYWAWHQPTTIEETGDVVAALRSDYPDYDVMIVETGYIWTWDSNDNANNIINSVHPDYSPPSPGAQKAWLIDLTQEVIDHGALGVIYWEPAWVSSDCWTQWGQGSHQEHATFFDFDNNLLNDGGVGWMTHQYDNLTHRIELSDQVIVIEAWPDSNFRRLHIMLQGITLPTQLNFELVSANGTAVASLQCDPCNNGMLYLPLPDMPAGIYYLAARAGTRPAPVHVQGIWIGNQ